ncbi:TetR/AcrR family transcriptional regulator [Bradyrhizobium sp. 2TAF24]|uniref:TetR/AcrR family transcriptional regulator n=1 Tax=Bradyrhizobium sp. 2TAF24 TaxID=3233011 RepID=UPI003F915CF8
MSTSALSPDPRTRILETAEALFYRHGIRSIGVDRLIAESGVAKATFYRHFPSKDDLALAFIRERDASWRAWLAATVARLAAEPQARPLAIFDAIRERFEDPEFRGCAFSNSIAEVAQGDSAVHQAAAEHKRAVTAMIAAYLRDAGVASADLRDELARALMLLLDGAIATAVREQSPAAAGDAQRIAATLLAARLS